MNRTKVRGIIFTAISVLIPFLALGTLELLLTLSGYGRDYRLFVEDTDRPFLLHVNPDIARKYFSRQENATTGLADRFRKVKSKNGIRLFILSESTGVGFPFHHLSSFSRMLQYWLNRDFPDREIEVVNLSFTAVNSYTLLDFTGQLVDYEPDAVLIYMGHNEYYGALGVASTSFAGGNPRMVRFLLRLRNFRIPQLLADIIHPFTPADRVAKVPDEAFMRRMAGTLEIPLHSRLYESGVRQFRENLDAMLETLEKRRVPVVLSNLVANERGLRPFISDSGDHAKRAPFFNRFDKGKRAFEQTDDDSALVWLVKADSVNSGFALLHYIRGAALYRQEKFREAGESFRAALDLDMLRFRAPSAFNRIIEEQSRKHANVILADSRALFERASPHGITGDELFTEHIHPTLDGYFLLTQSFYEGLKKTRIPFGDWKNEIPADSMRRLLPITPMDSLHGLQVAGLLRGQWPFNEPARESYDDRWPLEKRLAWALASRRIAWEPALDSLQRYYVGQRDYRGALKIEEELLLESPHEMDLYDRAGNFCMKRGDDELAYYYYARAFRMKPTPASATGAMLSQLRLDRPEKAVPYAEYLVDNPDERVDYRPLRHLLYDIQALKEGLRNDSSNASALYDIAIRYDSIGNYGVAGRYLDRLLRTDRNHAQARELKKRLDREIGEESRDTAVAR